MEEKRKVHERREQTRQKEYEDKRNENYNRYLNQVGPISKFINDGIRRLKSGRMTK